MAAISIKQLKGITPALVEKMKAQGIGNSEKLLAAAKTPAKRKGLAEQMGVDAKEVLELANRADLSRVKGIAGVFSDLLENAGVDTVKELAKRRPDNLHAKMIEVNQEQQLTKRPPTAGMVDDWVQQAKKLPKLLTY